MTNSPLGKYAPIVAAISAVGIVASWIVAEFLTGLGIMTSPPSGLKEIAFLAAGSVFGSAVAVNGYRAPLAAAHKRLDAIGAPPANDGQET